MIIKVFTMLALTCLVAARELGVSIATSKVSIDIYST